MHANTLPLHYSERIINQLVEQHGWTKLNEGAAEKLIAGMASAGELSTGSRTLTASFNENGRYLSLQLGFDELLDMDMRDFGLTSDPDKLVQGTSLFNQAADRYADTKNAQLTQQKLNQAIEQYFQRFADPV